MKLTPVSEFLDWAARVGIGPDPDYPELLAFVPERGENRFWEIPTDPQMTLVFFLAALDALEPWERIWGVKRVGGWSLAPLWDENATVNETEYAIDVVMRWLGIPTNYEGCVLFERGDRDRLVTLLSVENSFGWNASHDFYFVPDHGRQCLWLDHEGVLWVFFSDPADVPAFVSRMEALRFKLPTEAPPGITHQPWMGSPPPER